MESHEHQAGSKVIDINSARLDELAELIKRLPPDRRDLLMDNITNLLTIKEVAVILRVNVETVRRAIRRGELKASKIGRDFRISKIDLENYYASQGGGELFE